MIKQFLIIQEEMGRNEYIQKQRNFGLMLATWNHPSSGLIPEMQNQVLQNKPLFWQIILLFLFKNYFLVPFEIFGVKCDEVQLGAVESTEFI